jgi:hypothetical protein
MAGITSGSVPDMFFGGDGACTITLHCEEGGTEFSPKYPSSLARRGLSPHEHFIVVR